jgi:pimeloyl-ACP methyl ester carboxylesterase
LTSYRFDGMHVTHHTFALPLAHADPGGESIEVFAREMVAAEARERDLPYLVFFQGGPGFGAPRPERRDGWLDRALRDYRVLLLDQRGTGLSTPITARALAALETPEAQAGYLAHFRADAIVRDAEEIRRALLGPDGTWSLLGQSFGGFCVLRYLSAAPEHLREAFVTGGIPSLTRPAEDVYRATYPRVREKNRELFARYPHLQEIARAVADELLENDVRLPNGQRLTVEQFQQLGIMLGGSKGRETLHYLIEGAFEKVRGRRVLADAFLYRVLGALDYHTHPVFSVLHEAIYCQGEASSWAAERVRSEFAEFDHRPGQEFLFTGEMIYPWMFDQYANLQPLKEAAEILAAKRDWPRLYDVDRLATNTVPVAAAVYFRDMYVDADYSLESAERIPHVKTWVTSEYEHDGLRADGEKVLDRLIRMVRE